MLDPVIRLLSHLLVPLFLLGMSGSVVVVAITLTRDITDFLSDSGSEGTTSEGLS